MKRPEKDLLLPEIPFTAIKYMNLFRLRDNLYGIKLTAQFYYADVNTRRGSYTVERGSFVLSLIHI